MDKDDDDGEEGEEEGEELTWYLSLSDLDIKSNEILCIYTWSAKAKKMRTDG